MRACWALHDVSNLSPWFGVTPLGRRSLRAIQMASVTPGEGSGRAGKRSRPLKSRGLVYNPDEQGQDFLGLRLTSGLRSRHLVKAGLWGSSLMGGSSEGRRGKRARC